MSVRVFFLINKKKKCIENRIGIIYSISNVSSSGVLKETLYREHFGFAQGRLLVYPNASRYLPERRAGKFSRTSKIQSK
jgi:hypothetical protein